MNIKPDKLFNYIAFVLVLNAYPIRAANILYLSALPSPSHQIWSGVLQRALAARGHNITALSVDVPEKQTPNITFIHLENLYEFAAYNYEVHPSMFDKGPFFDIVDLARFTVDSCVPVFASKGLKQLMEYPKSFKFDLVIHDFVPTHCLLGVVSRFNTPPLIGASAYACPVADTYFTGNPQFPAFIAANHLHVGSKLNFFVRVHNVVIYIVDNLVRRFYSVPTSNALARKYFGDESLDIGVISASSVLNLVNLPPADAMYPLFQNVIPIGGLHIQTPQPIDQELYDFMSKAENGVVYFALGTTIKSEGFSADQVKYFLDAFGRFPSYRFVWKYDPAEMKLALPKNVMIRKWMNQNDILASPFVKAFIGHGGLLSCHEAAWYGVPQLLIPFIIDQKHNSAKAEDRGVALRLDKDNLSTEIIADKLDQVLHNLSFRENMMAYSRSFRDQPQSPLERAVFWVEYAMRHGSGSKLRSPGQDLGFFRQMALDVVAFLVAALIIIILLIKYIITLVLSIFVNKNNKVKTN